METIPNDILKIVLQLTFHNTFLYDKSLLYIVKYVEILQLLRLVCKRWNSILITNLFWNPIHKYFLHVIPIPFFLVPMEGMVKDQILEYISTEKRKIQAHYQKFNSQEHWQMYIGNENKIYLHWDTLVNELVFYSFPLIQKCFWYRKNQDFVFNDLSNTREFSLLQDRKGNLFRWKSCTGYAILADLIRSPPHIPRYTRIKYMDVWGYLPEPEDHWLQYIFDDIICCHDKIESQIHIFKSLKNLKIQNFLLKKQEKNFAKNKECRNGKSKIKKPYR